MTPRILWRLLGALACLLMAAPSLAHEIRPASLRIQQTADTQYAVTWTRPARGDMVISLTPVFPADCASASTSQQHQDGARTEWASIQCDTPLTGKTIHVDGLSATLIDVLATVRLLDGTEQSTMLRPDAPSFVVAEPATVWQTLRSYLGIGVEHILLGYDHLLFVFGLVLLLPSWRTLVPAITGFTVAHSITLGLASLDIVRVRSGPVEAMIALSIMLLAAEYLNARRGIEGWTLKHPWVVSSLAGLLHGLGFAGALQEVGLPGNAVPTALLGFNLGVELGQLAFVAVLLTLAALATRVRLQVPSWSWRTAGLAVGGVSAFWFVERVAGLW